VPYGVRELARIGLRLAEDLGIKISPQAARKLAEVACGTTARVLRRLETLRLYWPRCVRFSQERVERLLADEGADESGLTKQQRLCLDCLAESGGQTLRRLALRLGVDARYVAEEVEVDLIFGGYVAAGDGPGQELTAAGRELVSSRPAGAAPHTPLAAA